MSSTKQENKSQSERFKDKARELGCDEDERAFEDKLKRLAKSKPNDKTKKTTK